MSGNASINGTLPGSENCSFYYPDNSKLYLTDANKYINLVVPPIVLLIGIPGNMLTIVVILKQRKSITSTAVYLFMLAVSDLTFLIFGTFFDWLLPASGLYIRETNAFFCKIFLFLYYSSAQFSSWLLVAITVERIICILHPHKFKTICNSFLSKCFGLAIGFVIIALNSHFLYGYTISNAYSFDYGSKCGPVEGHPYITFYYDYWPWIDLTILFAVPFLVLMLGNVVIVSRLVKIDIMNKQRGKNDGKNKRSIGSISLLIFGLNIVFLISITPLSVFLASETEIYRWRNEVMCSDPAEYAYRVGLIEFIFSVTLTLSYVNPSVNFILYVLSGSKFRKCIKSVLLCKSLSDENAF